jgi:hypothetical protein
MGLVVLMVPTLFGEALSLAGGSVQVFAVTLGLVGFVAEYAAWTTGVGAVILNRFGGNPERPVSPPPAPSVGSDEPPPLDPLPDPPPAVASEADTD